MTARAALAHRDDLDARAVLDAEVDRLVALYEATGDERLASAVAALTVDAAADRDQLIRDMADRFAHDCWSLRAKAERLDRIARRYEATAWRRHQQTLRPPKEIKGRPEEIVFRILRSTGSFPGYSRLRTILNDR